ncbi:cytochrome b5 reductase 4 isoform X2 [Phymastichus coffea]|uniref:cytochrome b5 reductase 4 isoform X2 n=1 Tax=Phymastichus coffea TaxID=108790 RepID=UPI00273B787F|nr:cytochrome b5 reductase 4 isoform X2 [Phymastichus coffea]
MEAGQAARQSDAAGGGGADELDEKMRKIEMKPPATPAVGLLVKNAAILPSGIARVKQLRQSSQPPVTSSASGSATGNPRNKTALAPGHSLMDWIRLGSSGVDLSGVGGRPITVTPAELARHNSQDDAWIAIRGVVFNVSRYMRFHPGGVPELMKAVGKDATKLFDDVHAWVNYQSILQKCVVGRLEHSASADLAFESHNDKSKKSVKAVPDPAPSSSSTLRMDWRQTTSSLSFFYSLASSSCGECQVRKLSDSEHSVRICLDEEKLAVTRRLSLAGDLEWPPNCKRDAETSEIEISFKKKERGIWKTYGTFEESSEKLGPTAAAERTYSEYEVLENTPLCKVVHLLVLRARNFIQLVPPGRYLDAKMNVNGTEVSRPYTPVPSCLHPGDRPAGCTDDDESSCLYLMVKLYEDGALTPRLVQLTAGQTLLLSNTLGEFKIEAYDRYPLVNMLAAGSGLTVMLPIIKRALCRRNSPQMKLVNFNRSERQIFYGKQLDRAAGERRLSLTHVLSEASCSEATVARCGKVSTELLKELIGEHSSRACVFTCGPAAFMTAARDCLRELGWMPSQIHEFDD